MDLKAWAEAAFLTNFPSDSDENCAILNTGLWRRKTYIEWLCVGQAKDSKGI